MVATVLRAAVERGAVPGAVALVATRDGVLCEAAAGRRSLAGDAPMTVDSVFWLASMTKAVVSVAAMRLVERGLLALDGPVAGMLPGLAPQVLEGFDATGAPRLRPAKGTITLRHLLTHTSGYGYDTWHAPLRRALDALGPPRIPASWDDLRRTPLVCDPGTRWTYGISTDVLGLAVEAASRERLADHLRAHVLEPLGMHDTAFLLSPGQRGRLVGMHRRAAEGTLAPMDWRIGEGQGFAGGGGGLCGTAQDYGRFLRMLLNGGALDGVRLLRPETVAAMGRNQIGALEVPPLVPAVPERSNHADFFPGMRKEWGLGFLLNTHPGPNGRSAYSLAWAGLGNTYYWIDPARGVAGCVLAQLFPFADRHVLDLFGAVERAAYARL